MGINIFIKVAVSLMLIGGLNLAITPVLFRLKNNPELWTNNTYVQQAGYVDTANNLYSVWIASPLIFFFCAALFGWFGMKRQGQVFGE